MTWIIAPILLVIAVWLSRTITVHPPSMQMSRDWLASGRWDHLKEHDHAC